MPNLLGLKPRPLAYYLQSRAQPFRRGVVNDVRIHVEAANDTDRQYMLAGNSSDTLSFLVLHPFRNEWSMPVAQYMTHLVTPLPPRP